jgi:hypothetical protein
LFDLPICPSIIAQLNKQKVNKQTIISTNGKTNFMCKHNDTDKGQNQKREAKPQLEQRKLFVKVIKLYGGVSVKKRHTVDG